MSEITAKNQTRSNCSLRCARTIVYRHGPGRRYTNFVAGDNGDLGAESSEENIDVVGPYSTKYFSSLWLDFLFYKKCFLFLTIFVCLSTWFYFCPFGSANTHETSCYSLIPGDGQQSAVSLSKVNDYYRQMESEMLKIKKTVRTLQEQLKYHTLKNQELTKKLEQSSNSAIDINEVINNVIAKYDSDKIGLIDYALESLGGSIKSIKSTKPYSTKGKTLIIFGVKLWSTESNSNPRVILQRNHELGDCFAFKGNRASIEINLAARVYIQSVTLDHVPASTTIDAKTAPKMFSVKGLAGNIAYELGTFEYVLDGPSIQTFHITSYTNYAFDTVELNIYSNHGNPLYTCLYRFRVHGKRASDFD